MIGGQARYERKMLIRRSEDVQPVGPNGWGCIEIHIVSATLGSPGQPATFMAPLIRVQPSP